jgi:hypothetical protein
MVTLLITSVLILGFLAVVLYFWQEPNTEAQSHILPPPAEARGLFSPTSSELKALAESSASAESERQRTAIIERARHGEKTALQEAHSLDRTLYNAVLELLTDSADTDSKLLALVSYVSRADLPVNTRLARAMVEWWKKSPGRSSTAKTLHIVALADDASLYCDAVETAIQFWREGRLPDVSVEELRALFEGEFWLLSSEVRGSGSGFLLKRTLARARRELEAQARVNQ